MSQKSYISAQGVYLGTFINAEPPEGAVEVPQQPFAGSTWDGEAWNLTTEQIAANLAAFREGLSMSFGQMLIGLVAEEWITAAEGDAWLAGTLPAAVLTLINSLPEATRFAARVRAVTPSVVLRSNALVVALGVAAEKTPVELDTFFQTYSVV